MAKSLEFKKRPRMKTVRTCRIHGPEDKYSDRKRMPLHMGCMFDIPVLYGVIKCYNTADCRAG